MLTSSKVNDKFILQNDNTKKIKHIGKNLNSVSVPWDTFGRTLKAPKQKKKC